LCAGIELRTTSYALLSTLLLIALTHNTINEVPVNAQIVSDDWRYDIESYLREIDVNTTAEIVVYLVSSLTGHGIANNGRELNEIVELGVYIFNELPLDTPNGPVVGIGKTGKDNGVLVLVAIDEQEWRIEVGYGLEGYITDIDSNRIAEAYLVPLFTEGEYGEGLAYTVVALSLNIPSTIESEHLPIRGRYVYESTDLTTSDGLPTWVVILIVVIVIAYGGVYTGGRIGRRRSRGLRGGGGRSGGGGSRGEW
jgi:uncharacterized protein